MYVTTELELMIANAQVGIAKANMYPALNITAGGGLESFKASNWFNMPGSLFGLAAGSIAQPIFRRKELKTQFEIAKVQREQAVIQFRQSVLQATIEVANALVQADKLKQQKQIATEQVDTLKQAVFNAKLLFRSDMANYLEVITAQAKCIAGRIKSCIDQETGIRRNGGVVSFVGRRVEIINGNWEKEYTCCPVTINNSR